MRAARNMPIPKENYRFSSLVSCALFELLRTGNYRRQRRIGSNARPANQRIETRKGSNCFKRLGYAGLSKDGATRATQPFLTTRHMGKRGDPRLSAAMSSLASGA